MKTKHKIALIAAILITAGLGVYALLKYREKKEYKEAEEAYRQYCSGRAHTCEIKTPEQIKDAKDRWIENYLKEKKENK